MVSESVPRPRDGALDSNAPTRQRRAPARDSAAEYQRRQEIARAAGFESYWHLRKARRAGDARAIASRRNRWDRAS